MNTITPRFPPSNVWIAITDKSHTVYQISKDKRRTNAQLCQLAVTGDTSNRIFHLCGNHAERQRNFQSNRRDYPANNRVIPEPKQRLPERLSGIAVREHQNGPVPGGGQKASDVNLPPSLRTDLAPESSERIIATTADTTASGYAFQNKSTDS